MPALPSNLQLLAQEVFELLNARKETVSIMETVGFADHFLP